jgi:hypothetical protein
VSDLIARRMHTQHLWGRPMASIDHVIRHFGAIQAQEFLPAKWSIAQRLTGVTDRDVHAAFADGRLLRTHILRPTWHFVHAADIRWMLLASAPRVHAANAYYYRRTGVDEQVAKRSRSVFEQALGDGGHLTRTELAGRLEAAGMPVKGVALAYVIMRAELDGVLVSGPEKDSYALLDLRAPGAPAVDRDAAIAELVRRYFTGRGPATVKDFCTWATFTVTEARRGLDLLGAELVAEELDGRTYWSAPAAGAVRPSSPAVTLLQDYDEYVVGYFDSRDVIMHPDGPAAALAARLRALLVDGRVVGHWKHAVKDGRAEVTAVMSRPFTKPEAIAMDRAVEQFGAFLGLPISWT